MSVKFFVAFLTLCLPLTAAPRIAITFDNLPIHDNIVMNGEERTQKFIQALNEGEIKTVFFLIGNTIDDISPEKMACLKAIENEGHKFANHSYSHPFLSYMSVEDYVNDILKCHELASQFDNYRLWFRYPFLDVGFDVMPGDHIEKAKECAQKLKELGFRNGYVTIDSFDWFIEDLLLKAVEEGKYIDPSKLEKFYISHLRKTVIRYLDAKSDMEKALFHTHVFLFHATDLNALCLPAVIRMLKEDGWILTTPEEAFEEDNKLADFDDFIDFKIKQLTMDTGATNLHNSEKTTEEFNKMVLGE